jgi:hypothetical protein
VTRLLEQALAIVSTLPDDEQDELATDEEIRAIWAKHGR